jgi:transposase-like protein
MLRLRPQVVHDGGMTSPSYRGHRFPAMIIQHAIWVSPGRTLSYPDIQDLPAERKLGFSHAIIGHAGC